MVFSLGLQCYTSATLDSFCGSLGSHGSQLGNHCHNGREAKKQDGVVVLEFDIPISRFKPQFGHEASWVTLDRTLLASTTSQDCCDGKHNCECVESGGIMYTTLNSLKDKQYKNT